MTDPSTARSARRCSPSVIPVLVVLLALPSAALAWGPTGHRVVGAIAEAHLSAEARTRVAELLGTDSLPRVGTWADEIRSDPAWARVETWHYVNIGDGETYENSKKSETGDVLEAIGRLSKLLADPATPRGERVDALKLLVHFVGDIHQPLHVGRAEDRGGNDILVLWQNEPSNLHTVWDSGMIDATHLSYTELANFLDHVEPEQQKAWLAGGPAEWAKESISLRPQVYDLGDRKLGNKYVYRNWPTVEVRMAQAGIRLAALLEKLLGATPQP